MELQISQSNLPSALEFKMTALIFFNVLFVIKAISVCQVNEKAHLPLKSRHVHC